MKRPDPEELRPLTLHERWALDTGGTVTGKGKTPQFVLDHIKRNKENRAKEAKQANKAKRAK